jgi:ubiquinone/menaquinone biosynthesis C-methylase UbiE
MAGRHGQVQILHYPAGSAARMIVLMPPWEAPAATGERETQMTETTTPPAAGHWVPGRDIADAYERHLVPRLFEPWGRDLVARADPRPGDRVLDVASGTGILARLVASRVGPEGRVTGLDAQADMLAVARDRTAALDPPIAWEEASAVSIPLPDDAFDVVLCQQGLQFFDDRAAAVREMRRVTRPGGRLALSTWRATDRIPGYLAIAAAFDRHVPAAAGFVRAVSGLADAEELRELLDRAGWTGVRVTVRIAPLRFASVDEFVRCFTESLPVPDLRDLPAATRQAIVDEVAGSCGSYLDDEGFTFPAEAHVAVATR